VSEQPVASEGAAWEDEPIEDLATKDPGDYHGGPCGVMVFAVPFIFAGFLLRTLFYDRNPDTDFNPCPRDAGILALILLAMLGVGLAIPITAAVVFS
jgi:hypothetical protein